MEMWTGVMRRSGLLRRFRMDWWENLEWWRKLESNAEGKWAILNGRMTDVLHKSKEKGKKRHQFAGWDNHQVQARSLSSSNLGTYQSFSYGSPAPLLTKSLSGNQSAYHVPLSRAVQRSLSSGQDTASFLRRLAREYPLKSEDYEMLNLCGQGATAKVTSLPHKLGLVCQWRCNDGLKILSQSP